MAKRNKYDIDETLETPFSFEHLKRSWVYIKRHKKPMAVAFLVNFLASILSLLVPKIAEYVLDVTVPNKDYTQLLLLAALTAVIIVISILLVRVKARKLAVAGQAMVYDIRSDLFAHMQKLPFSYYDDRPHGKILVRVVQYVNNVSNMLSNGIIDFLLDIFNLIFIAVFMLGTDVRLALVVLAGLPILMGVLFLIRRPQRKAWQQVSNKGSNLNAYISESINGMLVTQSFTREEKNAEIMGTLSENARKSWVKAAFISNFVWVSADNISQIVTGFLYIVGVLWTFPAVSFGTIFAMGNYSWRFWQPINRLSQIYNDFINTIAYLERIFEMMDEPVVIDDCADAYPIPEMTGKVTFENVTFGYEPEKIILKNLSFTIEPGQSIALVGPTGAGKTTVVNLLSRFYDVTGGRILIDGHDICKVSLHSLRGQMGIMLQDSFIFSGTLGDNIRYGKLDATDDEIAAAGHVVHVDEFVDPLPKGYDTEVKEGGAGLSQGQKQLLSFARTVISDPKILILDEATSSIDTKTEQYVQDSINHLLKGRTSFIIAHRLSTIKNCDKIMYVRDQGISECGSHDELMAMKGDYYKLYTSQLQEM
ncbi:MAG: ABC transporter ATP-binding protein [Oscillospiraceae bacterium]